MRKKRYTHSDASNSYRKVGKSKFFLYSKILRPLSFHLSAPLANLGITANQVTAISLVLVIFSLCFLAIGNRNYNIIAFSFYLLNVVLDHVDGNIARLTDSASYFGKFFDSVKDKLFLIFFPFACGVGLINGNADGIETYTLYTFMLSALASIVCAVRFMSAYKFGNVRKKILLENKQINEIILNELTFFGAFCLKLLSLGQRKTTLIIQAVLGPSFLLMVATDKMQYLVLLTSFLFIIDFIFGFLYIMFASSIRLDVKRMSVSDSRLDSRASEHN